MIKIAVASSQGVNHELQDIPCQDAVKKYIKDDKFAVVLCDGAGSVENSQIASNFVCEFLSKYLCENLDSLQELQEDDIAKNVYEALIQNAERENINLDCTLLAIVGGDTNENIIFHIGDGIIIGENEIEEPFVVSAPENGEESYLTYFLSGEDAINHFRVMKANYDSYLLTSDGISNLLSNGYEVKSAAKIMFDWLKQNDETIVEEKIASEIERIFKQYTQDDISVAIIKYERENPRF